MSEDFGQRKERHPRCGRYGIGWVCQYCLSHDRNYRENINELIRAIDASFYPSNFEDWRGFNQW